MMSGRAINYAQARSYYEHGEDYYSRHLTSYDKWHGSLARRIGLAGELGKGQFDALCQHMAEVEGRKRIGFDATFSAPKSVSLALAESGGRKEELVRIHQTAVARALEEIEKRHLRTRSDGKKLPARSMACGEFVHFLNRNNELDLHSHCAILNMTGADGKMLSLDFEKLLERQKTLGLVYRQELAHELQAAGYELEITNRREGYFELKGFDRKTVMAHSTRRQEILAEAERQGTITAQGRMLANLATRKAKDTSVRYEDILRGRRIRMEDSRKTGMTAGTQSLAEAAREAAILKPMPDNSVLQVLARTGASCMKALPKEMACRSCPNSLWMCQPDDLVCFCRATRYVIWQASKPRRNITLLCSGRVGRSEGGE